MKLVVIALLALVVLSAVCAQDINRIEDCFREHEKLCPEVNNVDKICNEAQNKLGECIEQQNCDLTIQVASDFVDCLRSCKTGYILVDDQVNEIADCLTSYSNLNTFSVILALFLIMV